MAWGRAWVATVVCGILALGCGIGQKAADGEACGSNSDCKSGGCGSGGTCLGSSCQCPGGGCGALGSPSSACQPGWVCVHHSADPLSSLFGATGSESCIATCGSCPAHHVCADGAHSQGGAGGDDAGTKALCTYDASWDLPQIVVDQPDVGDAGQLVVRAGEPVTFHAAVTSPVGASIQSIEWTFDAEAAEGESVTRTFPPSTFGKTGHSVTVVATDARAKQGSAQFAVLVCGGMGVACSPTALPEDEGCCAGLRCQPAAGGSGQTTCQ